MRYILVCLFFLCCASLRAEKEQVPYAEVEEACGYANRLAGRQGLRLLPADFTCRWRSERVMLLQNARNNVFFIIVRKAHGEQMKERVLAFSFGCEFGFNNNSRQILDYYDRMIQQFAEAGRLADYSDHEGRQVAPMLRNIRWRQFRLNDVYDGQAEGLLSGCGPVAVAQVMKHYQWPDTARHDYCYSAKDGRVIRAEIEGKAIDWGRVKNKYAWNDPDSASLNELMKMIGVSLNVAYGENTSWTWMSSVKRAMVRHFGYSAQMFFASPGTPHDRLCALVRKDLEGGRPCVVAGFGHMFVCDGFYEGFYHLNMGWGGVCDGWYRLLPTSLPASRKTFFDSAILNIKPDTAAREKAVTLTQPGTLEQALTQEERENVSRLKISGPINGKDIWLLRRMAGFDDRTWYDSWHGRLADLDLSDAKITPDDTPFGAFNPFYVRYSVWIDGHSYNAGKLTHELYLKYKKNLGKAERSVVIEEVVPDSQYIVKAWPYPEVISKWMFMGCENLRSISFPKNVRSIMDQTFAYCTQLEEIRVPESVNYIAPAAFQGNRSLRRVMLPQKSNLNNSRNLDPNFGGYIFKGCNPELETVRY